MKKLLLFAAVAAFGLSNVNAQDNHGAIEKGRWLIEINTGSYAVGSTAFSLSSVDDVTQWSLGAEGGYFVMDNLAIKAGLGYQDYGDGDSTAFNYKIGAKYYIANQFPVGVDFTGVSSDASEDPSYVGVEGGYAWFISPKVSIEPKIRYNVSMNSDYYDDVFQALIGFAIHL